MFSLLIVSGTIFLTGISIFILSFIVLGIYTHFYDKEKDERERFY